jgi:Ca-activated chloride channel family protein
MKVCLLFIIFVLINFLPSNQTFAFTWDSKISEAEKNYKAGNYQKAFDNYKQAQIEDPGNESLKYNMGNTSYKLGKFDEASNIFKGLTESATNNQLKEKYTYNLGNSYYKLGKLEEAEKSYVEALKLDSNDIQAKKNLEKVREELKKRKQNEKDRKNKDKNKPDDKNKKNKDKPDNKGQDNKRNEQNKPEDKGKENNNKPEPDKQKQQKGNEQQQPQPKKGISKEEAEKWLNAVKDNNKEITKKQVQKKAAQQGYRSGKDW